MNQPSEPIGRTVGKTCVRVMKIEMNEKTRKTNVVKIHEGIIVQDTGPFVRVYNPAPLDKGGDVSPETSELFAVLSPRIWCEVMSERSTAFQIPPVLRR
jgi:hypothetical protein